MNVDNKDTRNKIWIAFYFIPCVILFSTTCSSQKLQVNAEFGWQKSRMGWSISNNNQPENISALKWKNLKLSRYDLSVEYGVSNRFFIGSNISLSNTHSGSVRDIDYSEYAPYGIISDEEYSAKYGNSNEIFFYTKYSLINSKNQDNFLRLSAGLYSHYQNFSLLGSIYQRDDLNSSYKNRWLGGVLGVIGKLTAKRVFFVEKVDIGLLAYQAKANWNLIEQFDHPISFRHNANGYMYSSNTSISYILCKKVNILYRFSIKKMNTWKGEDVLFYNNGVASSSQLNEVNQFDCNNSIGLSLIL